MIKERVKRQRLRTPLKVSTDTVIAHARTFMQSEMGNIFLYLWAEECEAKLAYTFKTRKPEDIAVVEGYRAASDLIAKWAAKKLKSELETDLGEEES